MTDIVGRISIAPCGHTGEVIIGTYVKCSQGCEGAVTIPPRGTIGHVINCACQPCQIRRKSVSIVLRDDKGNDFLKVDWNGTDDVIKAQTDKEGSIRHYHFIDADGKVIAKGNTTAYLAKGDLKIHAKAMMDSIIACTVAKGAVIQTLSDVVKITITINNMAAPAPFLGYWNPTGYP